MARNITARRNQSHKPQTLPAKFRAGFLVTLDGRTDLAKTLRAAYDAIVTDTGGTEETSHIKAALVERFVWLEAILQTIEHEFASGDCSKTEAIGRWIQAVNSLTGLAKVLGIERKPHAMPWLTPANANGDNKPQPLAMSNADGSGGAGDR